MCITARVYVCVAPLAVIRLPHQARAGRLGQTLFSRGQPYNVVLTHVVADFDSLAAAVGVAKLWNLQDPSVRDIFLLSKEYTPFLFRYTAFWPVYS